MAGDAAGGAGVWALAASVPAVKIKISAVCFMALLNSSVVLEGSVTGAPALLHLVGRPPRRRLSVSPTGLAWQSAAIGIVLL